MVIGNLPNYQFYNGFEGEPEVIFYMGNQMSQSLHVWDGYFADILANPDLSGKGWSGFTRDYHQCENAFSYNDEETVIDVDEYLTDLQQYIGCRFAYDDTAACLDLICSFLEEARDSGLPVTVTVS